MIDDPIVVTKLDAARSQLRTAIHLWFTGGDPVAIHTLVCAAHEILHRLFRNKGFNDLLFDSTIIKPEYRKAYASLLKSGANFFKHAPQDGTDEGPFTFTPSMNYMFIVMSVAALQRMGETLNHEELAVTYWLQCVKPELFTEDPSNKTVAVEIAAQVRQMTRSEFFSDFMKGRSVSHGK